MKLLLILVFVGSVVAQGQGQGGKKARGNGAQTTQTGTNSINSVSSKWVEKTIEVETKEKNPTLAKRELIELAISKASEDVIKDVIGEAKYSRNRTLIQSKIIKNNARFVPVTKPGDLVPLDAQGNGFKLTVTMKFGMDDLQSMLLENGLFYDSDSTPILLPVVEIVDKVGGRSWSWWQNRDASKADLQKISRELEGALKTAFWKNNFYVIRPQSLHYYEMLQNTDRVNVDWLNLADEWNAQILIQGEVTIAKSPQRQDAYQIVLHFSANQIQNSRSIAEVVRQYETEAGRMDVVVDQKLKEVLETVCADLSSQVLEAWQKGTIGSSLFRLTINGRVPLPLQDSLKDAIKNKVREIKNVKERLISTDEYVLEIETSLSPKELQTRMPKLSVQGYEISFDSANEKEAVYRFSKER
jgi:hypothetical protein